MRGVEVGGKASSRSSRAKVRVVPVHLQHHHLNLSLSDCCCNASSSYWGFLDLADKVLKVWVGVVGRLPSQCKLCQTLPRRLRRGGLAMMNEEEEGAGCQ